MTKVKSEEMVCHICGTRKSSNWRRDYDHNGKWTGKRICYECTLRISREKTIKEKDRLKFSKKRKCGICGSIETRIFSGREYWYKMYDSRGMWDHKSFLCHECKVEIEKSETAKIREQRLKERVCCLCGSDKTYIDNSGRQSWFEHKCDRNICTGWSCNKCHRKMLQQLPDSQNNIRKILADARTRYIDLNNFDNLTDSEKGRIVEQIVVDTYRIENYNKKVDNYNSPFDAIHPEYGILQIKGSSFDRTRGIWYFNKKEQKFDFIIIVCMDENRPWKNIERIYKIPYRDVSDQKSITITKDPSRIVRSYEEFRIDEKPFNDTYHNMEMYINYFL